MQQNLYGLYLSRDGATIRMPVNPESYAIDSDNNNSEYNVLGVGPIMIPRTPKLKTVSWSGLLPKKPDLGAVVTGGVFQPPQFYIEFVETVMADKVPVRFVANRYMEDGTPIFDTNMEVLVTRFQSEERGGETGDFYYEIALSEYRDYSPKTVAFQQPDKAAPVQASTEATRSVPKGQLAVGQTVLVNGDYFYSSQGAEPHSTFSGFRGVISRIVADDPQRAFPYHITDENGGAKGWVKVAQIQAVGA